MGTGTTALDHEEIRRLLARYDYGDAEGWADRLTPDGVFTSTPEGGAPTGRHGHEHMPYWAPFGIGSDVRGRRR